MRTERTLRVYISIIMPHVFLCGVEDESLELVQTVVDSFPSSSLNHRLLYLHERQQSQIHSNLRPTQKLCAFVFSVTARALKGKRLKLSINAKVGTRQAYSPCGGPWHALTLSSKGQRLIKF